MQPPPLAARCLLPLRVHRLASSRRLVRPVTRWRWRARARARAHVAATANDQSIGRAAAATTAAIRAIRARAR